MDYETIKQDFYRSFKESLIKFSSLKDNKDIYVIVFDCDSSNGQICIRYGSESDFEERKKDYNKYKESQEKMYGKYAMLEYKYSVGDLKFIEFEEQNEMKHFNETYYYIFTGDNYYGDGEPIEKININGDNIVLNESLEKTKQLWENIIVDCIKKLEIDELGINKTNDFVMYMLDHDLTKKEKEIYVKKIIDEKRYKKVFLKNKVVKNSLIDRLF